MKERLEIIQEAIDLIKQFPKDKEVFTEQSKIIRARLKEIKEMFFTDYRKVK